MSRHRERSSWAPHLIALALATIAGCTDPEPRGEADARTPEPDAGASSECTADGDCSDGADCNGAERCEAGACVPGSAPAAGTECTLAGGDEGVCEDEACVAVVCGDSVVAGEESCDDGADGDDTDGCTDDCTHSCESDADCSDADVCTGTETCDTSTHTCVEGTDLDCGEPDACHTASCDSVMGCVETLIDADGDGFAAATLGACGMDCDDSERMTFPGAEELCDTVDNDCDGDVDEEAPFWFADCDGDGFAAADAPSEQGCHVPPPEGTGCARDSLSDWTALRPDGAASIDCNDADGARHPGATETPGGNGDENCDGQELCYADADQDGYRSADEAVITSVDGDCRDAMEAPALMPGGDCDDHDEKIHPDQVEIVGDEIDQDCDGDELCYADEDGDASRTDAEVRSVGDTSCRETGEARRIAAVDCCDADPRAHPGQTTYFAATDGESTCGGWDFDCSGGETALHTGFARCDVSLGTEPMCFLGQGGWEGVAAPSCGGSGMYVTSCTGSGKCDFVSEPREQACR